MGGLWFFLGLGAALGVAGADAVTKRSFADLSPYGMSLGKFLYVLPFVGLGAFFIDWPPLDRTFWLATAAALPLEVVAVLLYMQALKTSNLSLCIPFLAFTPVFMILTGRLLLGEVLNWWGLAGITLIAGGSYILSLGGEHRGWWAPLKALWEESGPKLMLGVAAIYSCTAALGKVAILHSDPGFFGVIYPLILSGIMLAGYPLSRERPVPALAARYSWGICLGLFMAGSLFCHFYGIRLAPAAYLVAVKRSSILFSVLLGGLWLKERPFLPRFWGASLMLTGVILIAWKGN